ncbi:unnamed protein product [Pedinophyceae sp. YPF-701]|nr:unnamed protein product [Pedinophyceae sp. YPF-701]
MSMQFTVKKFPATPTLKNHCGLPWGCVVSPFADVKGDASERAPRTSSVARCSSCYAYVNHQCAFEHYGWICSLCQHLNDYRGLDTRYARGTVRARLPELRSGVTELIVDDSNGIQASADAEIVGSPIVLALVDATAPRGQMEAVRSSLLGAIEAMEDSALFGLITFSRRVTMYDLQGPDRPVAVHVPLSSRAELRAGAGPTRVALEDAMPLAHLLCPIGQCRERVQELLEWLEPEHIPNSPQDAHEGHRGLGGALQAVMQQLSTGAAALIHFLEGAASGNRRASTQGSESYGYAGARLLAFVSGRPDYGAGAVRTRGRRGQQATTLAPPKRLASMDRGGDVGGDLEGDGVAGDEEVGGGRVDVKSRAFYQDAAIAAAALGVCVDLFVTPPTQADLGLEALEPLTSNSGGCLLLYPPPIEVATLPHDVFRRIAAPHAHAGRLRLRCSPDLAVGRAYGRLFTDEQHEALHHVVACDSIDTYAFDLEFTSPDGLLAYVRTGVRPPVLQMTFSYTALVPRYGGESDHPRASGLTDTSTARESRDMDAPTGFLLQRRVRVLTVRADVASSAQEIYYSCHTGACLSLLTHKALRAVNEEGTAEAKELLADWVTNLVASWNCFYVNNFRGASAGLVRTTDPGALDMSLEDVPAVSPLIRMAYALIRSPVLQPAEVAAAAGPDAADGVVFTAALWGGLPPDLLMLSMYPELSVWNSPDTLKSPAEALSSQTLVDHPGCIFLIDSLSAVIVYYTPDALTQYECPPPRGSTIHRAIASASETRRVAPRVIYVRAGVDATAPLSRHFIEDAAPYSRPQLQRAQSSERRAYARAGDLDLDTPEDEIGSAGLVEAALEGWDAFSAQLRRRVEMLVRSGAYDR